MKRASVGCVLVSLMASASLVGAAEKTEPKPISALSWLVGGVWTAEGSKVGLKSIETRYRWSDNDAYIGFTTHFILDKGTVNNYEGNLFWDPARQTLAIWYMDRGNAVIEGPITITADGFRVTFRGHDFEGKMADLRVDVVRRSDDHYHWSVSEKQADAWKELAAVEYLRTGRADAAAGDGQRAAVQAVLDAQVAAWNRGDLEGFMKGYEQSAALVYVNNDSVVRGWQPLLEFYRRVFDPKGGKEMGTLALLDLELTSLGEDGALVSGRYRVTTADGRERGGLYTLVLRRLAEGWRTVYDRTSSGPQAAMASR